MKPRARHRRAALQDREEAGGTNTTSVPPSSWGSPGTSAGRQLSAITLALRAHSILTAKPVPKTQQRARKNRRSARLKKQLSG